MHEFDFGFPGVCEAFEACREMASDAVIEHTYFVTSPTSRSNDLLHVTRSLSTAFELWAGGPERRLSVAFDWSFGAESGSGSIRYGELTHSMPQLRFTKRIIRDLIVQNITHRLFVRNPHLETA
jgi:hypothetical protein